jgi:oligopeptide transport system substrate-binding protein
MAKQTRAKQTMTKHAWRRFCCAGLAAVAAVLLSPGAVCAAGPMVFHRGNDAEPTSLDPHIVGAHWEIIIVGDLFLGLTTQDPAGKPIPGAAESWTTSADGLIWTFKLRPGLVWSDGTPMSAEDYVFGFQRLLDPKTAAQYASIQYVIKNAEAVNSGKLPPAQVGVQAPDARTLVIQLENPTPYLPGLLAHPTAFPIPRHVYAKYGSAWINPAHVVSNGAYKLVEWKAHEYVKAVKNPLFYDARNVAIDEVYYYPTDDQAAALKRYRAGELDANLGTRGFPISQAAWLKENMPGQARTYPTLGSEYITFNMRKPPFSDIRLRTAVALCLDRPVLAEKVVRDGVPADSFVPPGIDNYHNAAHLKFTEQPIAERRAEAKRLLAEAGYTADKPFSFPFAYMISQDSRRSVVAQAAMLKECNMVMRMIGNEPKIHYDALRQADFTAAQARWGADYDDPNTFLYLLDSRSGPYNFSGYKNPAFDRLMDEASSTLDLEKRAAILAQAEQIALDDVPITPISYFSSKSLVAPYVKGYVDNVANVNRTRWLRIER